MYQQAGLLFFKFRLLLAGAFAIGFLMLISALVTAIGSGTVLDRTTHPRVNITDPSIVNSPNAVTDSIYKLADGTKRVTLSTGTALYGACRSVTNATARSSKSVLHGIGSGTSVAVHGVSSGVMFTLHTTANNIMFTLHMPGKVVGSIHSGHAVSALIRPANYNPVPVITTKPSPALLARIKAQARQDALNQQQTSQLQAAQLAANRGLGGSIVAGDPHHGGYPTKWEDARQDSTIDSWGMFNRECVSYTAWKVYQTYGNMPYWGGVGNANQWLRNAKTAGIPTSATPRVHSVAISMRGYYGHAAWVEAVNGDMIYVSQYNYDLHGHYSEMWVSSSYFTYIYFK